MYMLIRLKQINELAYDCSLMLKTPDLLKDWNIIWNEKSRER